jgi:hypothetical protein
MEYEWDDYGIYPEIRSGNFLGGNWTIANNTGGYIHFLWQVYDENEDKILFFWRVSKGKIIEVNGRFPFCHGGNYPVLIQNLTDRIIVLKQPW